MIDISTKIGNLHLKRPIFLAAGPLTMKLEHLIRAEELGLGAVDTKVTISRRHPKTKCYERTFWEPTAKILHWNLGMWDGEFLYIEDAVNFIKRAKKQLSIPVFGNFKEDSDDVETWMSLAKRLEEAGADALVTFFTFIPEFVGREMEMMERIIAPVCSAVRIPVIFKLQPIAGLSADVPKTAKVMADAGLSAIQISDGIGGYPSLTINKPPYHPFDCMDFQARDGFISGPYLRPLVYKTVFEFFLEAELPIICSGGIWDAQSAIEAILYGSSVIASSSGPCIKGWEMFNEIVRGLEGYMTENHYSSIQEFRGLASRFIKENAQIGYPNCYAFVDVSRCTGCEQCLPPAHCSAISVSEGKAKIDEQVCIGCCICKNLCPENAIEIKMA